MRSLYRRAISSLLGHRPSTGHIQQPLESMPVPSAWILAGEPVARAITITESRDKRYRSGVWECTAGTFEWHFGVDEIIHILEGEVFVEDGDGRQLHLKPGDVAHFPAGTSTRWHVPQHVRKFFTHREPHGVERVLRGL
ncbi:MAG TPA: cupin domain-containing protein [Polyangiales bacterium]|nr:cupin domain-containing protein [Polyangiales bacterium]